MKGVPYDAAKPNLWPVLWHLLDMFILLRDIVLGNGFELSNLLLKWLKKSMSLIEAWKKHVWDKFFAMLK